MPAIHISLDYKSRCSLGFPHEGSFVWDLLVFIDRRSVRLLDFQRSCDFNKAASWRFLFYLLSFAMGTDLGRLVSTSVISSLAMD